MLAAMSVILKSYPSRLLGLFRELAAGRLALSLRRLVCRHICVRPDFVRLRFLIFLIAFLSLRHGTLACADNPRLNAQVGLRLAGLNRSHWSVQPGGPRRYLFHNPGSLAMSSSDAWPRLVGPRR